MSGDHKFAIVPFAKTFDRSEFHCGVAEMDQWLQSYASQSERIGNTRTFFAVNEAQIIGFYSQRAYQIDADEVSRTMGIGHRRYPMPAILIARLAVHSQVQGCGVGSRILLAALYQIAKVSREIGFEVVAVRAISQDVSVFYRKRGFIPAENQPLRLYLPVRDLRKTFGIS